MQTTTAEPWVPASRSLPTLRQAAEGCRGCDLWQHATQTVFGEGPAHAPILMIGEQPGDQEDQQGHPFVGPAGRLLDKCLEEAGLARQDVYLTNAVKHFKWEPVGERRLHKKPSIREVHACRPWLDAELAAVAPGLIVCLGATASQALLGSKFRLTQQRGQFLAYRPTIELLATVHPSSLLRAPDAETRHRETARFVAELASVAAWLSKRREGSGRSA